MKKSELERTFETLLRQCVPDLAEIVVQEHRFHSERRWRFDFAWPPAKVAIEIQGGIYGKPVFCHNCGARVLAWRKDGTAYPVMAIAGRHTFAQGYTADAEKLLAAQAMGWILFYVTKDMLFGDPWPFFETLRTVYWDRMEETHAEKTKAKATKDRSEAKTEC